MIQNIKGTKDILPTDIAVWHTIENVFRTIPQLYGYEEIRTPLFESTSLFKRGVGEGTDIVGKEMYVFDDKGGESLTLRPELTAPVARAILQYNLIRHYPTLRVWYYGACFRYEQPQLGRQRQFHQVGAECAGSTNPESDAEIILLAHRLISSCGITDFTLHINSIGTSEERSSYRTLLLDYLNSHRTELSEDAQRRMDKNPLRTLDSKDERDKAVCANAPSILDSLGADSSKRFAAIQEMLSSAGIAYSVNPALVRGLDYYSHTVFEFRTDKLGSQDALGGGGRYDNLFESLGAKPIPGVGFGLGVERLILLMQQQQLVEASHCDVVIITSQSGLTEGATIAESLRSAGLRVKTDVQRRSFKAQLKDIDKSSATYAVILGDDEVSSGNALIKNLASHEQQIVALSD
ncbi:MAG: histidine--tRNA ligase, partial [Candidatus Kapabacteria bacterium]|nr:histidine--tRNA ligase [Candidatus Kapabacteria bacterium]